MRKHSEDSHPYNWIEPSDFEFICFNLTKDVFGHLEPIPDYKTRDNALLESSLASPKNAYVFEKADLINQASVLFYSLIKNHPFNNGNKRIAVISLLVFLSLNSKWLDIHPLNLYKIALLVAESASNDREKVLKKLNDAFNEFVIDRE